MKRFDLQIILVTAAMTLASCGSRTLSVPAEEAYPAHFRDVRDRILKPRCETCHGKIVLYKALMTDLVVAGDPTSSRLYKEIEKGSMPKYGGKLTDDEITAVKNWIQAGAKND